MASKKSIIIYNDYKDLTINLICSLIIFVSLIFISPESEEGTILTTAVIFIIPAAVSFNYALKSNISLPKAVLSFIIKITLSLILLVKLLQLWANSGNNNAYISERTKKWQIVSTGIFSLFVFDLIKEHRWKRDFHS